VYVANNGSNNVSAYTLNATTGVLTPLGTVRCRQNPTSLAVTKGTTPFTFLPKFAYVPNAGSNTVSAYAVNATTGALTPVAGSPFAIAPGASCAPLPCGLSLTMDPFGRFVYVANNGSTNVSGNVTAYAVNATTGALTPVPGSPFATGGAPFIVDPSGQFVYVRTFNSVSAYQLNATTGALTPVPGSPFATGTAPSDLTVDPSGQFVYVPNISSNDVSAYRLDPTTGALTPVPGSPFATAAFPRSITVDPSWQFVYVLSDTVIGDTSTNISAYTLDAMTGALTPVAGSPFAAGTTRFGLKVDPAGRFVYVPNDGSNNISAYTIDPTTGVLIPVAGSPFAAGTEPFVLTVEPSGKFVYVVNFISDNISAYTLDATTGALTPVAGSPFASGGAAPSGVTADPSGQFLYVPNQNIFSNNVSAFMLNATTGALAPVPGSPFPAGNFPGPVTITRIIQ
jgi:6-phosphogluconolactonase (cycloisomerase 2 family)